MRQLDYALLRVEGSPGNDPIGNENQDGNNRGWIKIPENSHEIIEKVVTPYIQALKFQIYLRSDQKITLAQSVGYPPER